MGRTRSGSRGHATTAAAVETGTVCALTHEGEGVVHGGKTVFVAGALPGEPIRFRRTRRHRQHDEGELLELIERSTERVTPRCAHFGVCGGCALQHLAPAAQIATKERELRETLARVARLAPDSWLMPLTGPLWGYRRRARLGVKFVRKKGRVLVGFRERAAPYVAELTACEVLAAPAAALITPLAGMLDELSIRERLPQIEVAVGDNATALVLRVLEPPSTEDRARLAAFAAAHEVRLYLQSGAPDALEPLCEEGEALRYGLPQFGLRMEFAPTDFIQVNATVNEALVERAVSLLELTADASVLDLFCGLGNFTLPLARRAASVVGVEGQATLVTRARANAARNAIGNAAFHCADLAAVPDATAAWAGGRYTHVLLDPPRSGAREALATVARLAPRRVLYISCHPGSLARDLEVLVHGHGFKLAAAGVVDMFPHTAHVESLALLTGDSAPVAAEPPPP
ncbi:MAG: 23S rRNA (uracil(1939)-C(5))-methyltransferase RlmD [Gammaproteobacteria bacterium]|nr:23S rRNA (uracil(1939)-C(5))-methyltransferase RlmD [Gammaproteobacteria bacterium]